MDGKHGVMKKQPTQLISASSNYIAGFLVYIKTNVLWRYGKAIASTKFTGDLRTYKNY